ncbi:MAG TPA: protein kinase [bacterium]|nr:protein kinase [bacterium]
MDGNNFCFGCFSPKGSDYKCKNCGYVYDLKEGPEQSHLFPGTTLNNRYILGKVIGAGGFGITYIAFDPKLQVRLAIKEFFPRQIASRDKETRNVVPFGSSEKNDFINGLKYFLNEARSAAMFETHQNIVGVKDMFEENGTAYMVMPYISGTPFDSFLTMRGGVVDFATAMSVLAPIMDAVAAIHEKNLLHRDISPENIFITSEGVPKLLDFGSARPTVASETLSMTPVIKEGYAPLEQYSRQGEQGPWTDIYSMAATIYKAVSGQTPPPAMERFTNDALIELSKVCPDIPGYAEKAIVKALSLRASDRFQNMLEFLNALTKGKSVEPLKFNETSSKKPGNKLVLIAGSAVAGIAVISVGLFFALSSPKKVEPVEKPVEKVEKVEKPVEKPVENLSDNLSDKVSTKSEVLTKSEVEKVEKVDKVEKPVEKKKNIAKHKEKIEKKPEIIEERPVEKKKDVGVSIGGSGNFVIPREVEKGLTPEQYFKDGFKYELARNMAQAISYYEEACKGKFTNGCYRLGKVKKDDDILSKARGMYEKECKKGTSSSCITLAEMMLKGEGGAASPFEATTALAKECSAGKVNGCFLLAGIWEKGENINKDLEKARKYYGYSCDQGSKDGCFKYAEMLENGIGGPADAQKAAENYKKACQKGFVRACMKAKKQ